jgi:hypothetical protein
MTSPWRSRLNLLQRLHLMAHRTLRDVQLFGGAREALVACRGFEGFQGVQSRQTAQHHPTFMRKTQAG